MADLKGMKVAAIVADGFEQIELDGPMKALRDAGVEVEILAEDDKHLAHIHGVNHFDKGDGAKGSKVIDQAKVDDYDGLLVPGGAVSPDTMRQSKKHLALVKGFMSAGKPLAVICHGPWLLASADLLKGRTLTSYHTIQDDLRNAGARWEDREVVRDGNLVSSRKPDDIPAFNKKIIEEFAEGRHGKGQTPSGQENYDEAPYSLVEV